MITMFYGMTHEYDPSAFDLSYS